MAIWLANVSLSFRGEVAVANGWIQRARRLLANCPPEPEHALLACMEAHIILMTRNDPGATLQRIDEVLLLAKQFRLTDVEMLAYAIQGLALVTQGQVTEGMNCLDEAAAAVLAGEVQDFDAKGTTLCYMVEACTRIRDYGRAKQWCARVEEEFARMGVEPLFAFCRPNRAVLLMWLGLWQEAERELLQAKGDMEATLPPQVGESIARLAELRWRQGRWEEAEQLFKQVEREGIAQAIRAELALSLGQPGLAVNILERHLRKLPLTDRLERVTALDVLVRTRLARGETAQAQEAQAELDYIAQLMGTDPFKAAASAALGRVLAAQGHLTQARQHLEDAVDLFQGSGGVFEGARVQLALAEVLMLQGSHEEAAYEAMAALNAFKGLGAVHEAGRAEAVLGLVRRSATENSKAAASPSPSFDTGLTRREIEVLQLLAAGKSNQEIAAHLVLSVRTVERHISTIYEKLGATGKAARASATAYAIKQHLL
ncbi:MAG: hypothetical protein HY532_04420 [Chloroflexi bacterium]|nr:hypothetical protein [Chloroflexota bacterium]